MDEKLTEFESQLKGLGELYLQIWKAALPYRRDKKYAQNVIKCAMALLEKKGISQLGSIYATVIKAAILHNIGLRAAYNIIQNSGSFGDRSNFMDIHVLFIIAILNQSDSNAKIKYSVEEEIIREAIRFTLKY